MTSLGAATWDELASRPAPVLAVPIGSCEQHGPHLPLNTDTIVATALAAALSERRADVVVAPALAVTASGEHAGFPGTLSIGTEVLVTVLVELVRSADWVRGVVLVNGHGGNADALALATALLHAEGRRVLSWWPTTSASAAARADAHAGFTETSLLLHLAPHLVRTERAAAGDTRPLADTLPELRRGGVRAVSANGVLGDPGGATAADGAALFARLVDDLVARVDAAAAAWTA